jgi:hypothetical protein
MMRMKKRGWREVIVLLAALACAGSWAAGQVRSMRDRSEVAKMTEKMKTVCVGRFLVDVPAQAEVSLSREMIDGFEVETVPESEADFYARVAAREVSVAAKSTDAEGKSKGGMVEARDLRISGMVGKTLIFGRDRTHGFDDGRRVEVEWVSVEAYAHVGDISISLSMKYANEEKAKAAETLLSRVQVLREDEIPSLPGFCVERVVFAEPLPPHDTEHIVMHIGLPDHPDLGMAFASLPGGGRSRSLLSRVSDNDAEAGADEMLRVTKLRAEKRDINTLPGEEVLERVRELNFATTFGFMWETQGVKNDPLQPFLSLELHAGISREPGGKPADSSLHEDAVLALWDTVASSIRLRPSGPPPAADPPQEPPAPKLGMTANAGDVCPQSGWWQCREGGPGIDVHGGQVQYIRKGERMPQVLLLPRQTLWQKVRRIQPSMESPRLTAWTLVDKRMRPRVASVVSLAQAGPPVPGFEPVVGARAAVGTYVRTGEVCPASGWWRCEEVHALDNTRWFAGGSVLPPATFQVPAGVFGKADGPEVIQRRSLWQLVRQVEAPVLAQSAPQSSADVSVDEPPAHA